MVKGRAEGPSVPLVARQSLSLPEPVKASAEEGWCQDLLHTIAEITLRALSKHF